MLTGFFFLVKCPGSYIIYKAQNISFIYTYHLYINVAFSYEILFALLVAVLGCLYMLLPS